MQRLGQPQSVGGSIAEQHLEGALLVQGLQLLTAEGQALLKTAMGPLRMATLGWRQAAQPEGIRAEQLPVAM
jgi:hypothetical protein